MRHAEWEWEWKWVCLGVCVPVCGAWHFVSCDLTCWFMRCSRFAPKCGNCHAPSPPPGWDYSCPDPTLPRHLLLAQDIRLIANPRAQTPLITRKFAPLLSCQRTSAPGGHLKCKLAGIGVAEKRRSLNMPSTWDLHKWPPGLRNYVLQ